MRGRLQNWPSGLGRCNVLSKGPTRAHEKAQRARAARAVVRAVRAACVERDGYCRFGLLAMRNDWNWMHCDGLSEWAHFGPYKRFRTRGQAPARRHITSGSLMLCRYHHAMYDAGLLLIEAGPDGCDGVLIFRLKE